MDKEPSSNYTESLAAWLKKISEEEMPALSSTAEEIAKLADDDDCHTEKLAEIILQDAAMTGQVLRMTNSAYHIRRANRMNTVSRAIVMLGFEEVRSICLTIAVFDQMKNRGDKSMLSREMARAFHAATQARMLAIQRGDIATEEIFIAALLRHLGDMAIWSFGGEVAEELAKALEDPQGEPEQIEEKILGFPLSHLTQALSRKWGLGKLVEEATKGDNAADPRTRAINLSHKWVRAAEKGVTGAELQSLMAEIAEYANSSIEATQEMLEKSIEEAQKMAEKFGANEIAQQIGSISIKPLLSAAAGESEQTPETATRAPAGAAADARTSPAPTLTIDKRPSPSARVEEEEEVAEFPNPDPLLQLSVLRDISARIQDGTDVHEVLELILSGIYRGVGMDRAVFALLSPNRKYLRAKNALGINRIHLLENFKFDVGPESPSIFQDAIEAKRAIWVEDPNSAQSRGLVTNRILQVIGHSPFFVAPTIVGGRPIGVFYADRRVSERPLDQEAFDGFKQFCLQANLSLEHLGQYRQLQ